MIYSFASTDKRKSALLQILTSSGIDFEISEHDHSVVRVLGQVSGEVVQKIKDAGISTHSLVLAKPAESNCYDLIAQKSELTIIAGPCAVESAEQLELIGACLKRSNVKFLRGGAYKPRTKVDSFQGLGIAGLKLLRELADRLGMFVVTEVMDRSQIDVVAEYADILQVGSRNMYNYTLLTALGSVDRPILLKRGMSATLSEWYSAAEYISRGGNERLILCERGIRTFEPEIAHTMDVAAIVLAKSQTGYPIIADTSHAAGRPDLVEPLAMAAVAAGADGIMIEIHPTPAQALSDGKQALRLPQFEQLAANARLFFATRKSTSTPEQD